MSSVENLSDIGLDISEADIMAMTGNAFNGFVVLAVGTALIKDALPAAAGAASGSAIEADEAEGSDEADNWSGATLSFGSVDDE